MDLSLGHRLYARHIGFAVGSTVGSGLANRLAGFGADHSLPLAQRVLQRWSSGRGSRQGLPSLEWLRDFQSRARTKTGSVMAKRIAGEPVRGRIIERQAAADAAIHGGSGTINNAASGDVESSGDLLVPNELHHPVSQDSEITVPRVATRDAARGATAVPGREHIGHMHRTVPATLNSLTSTGKAQRADSRILHSSETGPRVSRKVESKIVESKQRAVFSDSPIARDKSLGQLAAPVSTSANSEHKIERAAGELVFRVPDEAAEASMEMAREQAGGNDVSPVAAASRNNRKVSKAHSESNSQTATRASNSLTVSSGHTESTIIGPPIFRRSFAERAKKPLSGKVSRSVEAASDSVAPAEASNVLAPAAEERQSLSIASNETTRGATRVVEPQNSLPAALAGKTESTGKDETISTTSFSDSKSTHGESGAGDDRPTRTQRVGSDQSDGNASRSTESFVPESRAIHRISPNKPQPTSAISPVAQKTHPSALSEQGPFSEQQRQHHSSVPATPAVITAGFISAGGDPGTPGGVPGSESVSGHNSQGHASPPSVQSTVQAATSPENRVSGQEHFGELAPPLVHAKLTSGSAPEGAVARAGGLSPAALPQAQPLSIEVAGSRTPSSSDSKAQERASENKGFASISRATSFHGPSGHGPSGHGSANAEAPVLLQSGRLSRKSSPSTEKKPPIETKSIAGIHRSETHVQPAASSPAPVIHNLDTRKDVARVGQKIDVHEETMAVVHRISAPNSNANSFTGSAIGQPATIRQTASLPEASRSGGYASAPTSPIEQSLAFEPDRAGRTVWSQQSGHDGTTTTETPIVSRKVQSSDPAPNHLTHLENAHHASRSNSELTNAQTSVGLVAAEAPALPQPVLPPTLRSSYLPGSPCVHRSMSEAGTESVHRTPMRTPVRISDADVATWRSSSLTHRIGPPVDRLNRAAERASSWPAASADGVHSHPVLARVAAVTPIPPLPTLPTMSNQFSGGARNSKKAEVADLANRVYDLLVRRLDSERQRRGQ